MRSVFVSSVMIGLLLSLCVLPTTAAEVFWDGTSSPADVGYVLRPDEDPEKEPTIDYWTFNDPAGLTTLNLPDGLWSSWSYMYPDDVSNAVSPAGGWHVEAGANSIYAEQTPLEYGFGHSLANIVSVATGTDAEGDGVSASIVFEPTGVYITDSEFYTTNFFSLEHADDDTVHTAAIGQLPGSSEWYAVIDGVYQGTFTPALDGVASTRNNQVNFGSGWSGAETQWDYVRITEQVIPEPSTMMLLLAGLAVLGLRRRR